MPHSESAPYPAGLRTLAFGGDYNPEQWPEELSLIHI